jgi:16S rRNA (cytosine1402-N4)-methyltransferase
VEIHHRPVLLEEVLSNLVVSESGLLVDGTMGEGGHSKAVLERFSQWKVIGLDRDPGIQAKARERLKGFGQRVSFVPTWFDDFFADQGSELKAQAILLDLGISIYHYQESGRGFTFRGQEPLDMRLDKSAGPNAADLLNQSPESALADLIYEFGEERLARKIARRIVKRREKAPFALVGDLEEEVWLAYPPKARHGRLHPATKTFQALRIAVNQELERLDRILEIVWDCLAPGGRLGIITFHSLEDRRVKQAFRAKSQEKEWQLLTKRPLIPTEKESEENPSVSECQTEGHRTKRGAEPS